MTKAAARAVLQDASKRTDLILDRAERAREALRSAVDGRIFNGAGIYADPSRVRAAISDALAHLQAAQNAMRDARWPTAAEYEAAE